MKLAIVIINYNTANDTIACLNSLQEAKIPEDTQVHTYLIDNASTDDSVKLLEPYLSTIRFIESPINNGFAGGNNLGIKAALQSDPTHILLLNNDTLVPPDFFTTIVNSAIKETSVGIVTPKIYFAKGYEFHKERYKKEELGKVIWSAGGKIDWDNVYGPNAYVDEVDNGQFTETIDSDFATGACMLIKREVIDKVGIFDERYFLYLEDLEYSVRAKRAGWGIVFDPSIFLWHKVSQSSGVGSDLNDYFITRNRLLFGMTYAGFRAKFALLREAFRFLISGRPAQRAGVKDFFARRFGKGTWLK